MCSDAPSPSPSTPCPCRTRTSRTACGWPAPWTRRSARRDGCAFLLADLVRYRNALPGSVSGYLELLQDALAGGYDPGPDDLAALRALRHRPVAAALLERCQVLAERSVRARLAGRAVPAKAPAPRSRLLALPGGRAAEAEPERPKAPAEPARPTRPAGRPAPKPSEVFPPRRRPVPPPQQRAAG